MFFPWSFQTFGLLLNQANGLCESIIVSNLWMCKCPWGSEPLGYIQWKRFAAALVQNCNLSLHKAQLDSDIDTNTSTHVRRCTVTHNKLALNADLAVAELYAPQSTRPNGQFWKPLWRQKHFLPHFIQLWSEVRNQTWPCNLFRCQMDLGHSCFVLKY